MAKIKVYKPYQKTKDERLKILMSKNGLELAVEDRFTNLRIWVGRLHAPINPDNTMGIFMRLDRANQYSAPISEKSFGYLKNPNTPVKELVKFGFPANIDCLDEILEITKDMPIRPCVAW